MILITFYFWPWKTGYHSFSIYQANINRNIALFILGIFSACLLVGYAGMKYYNKYSILSNEANIIPETLLLVIIVLPTAWGLWVWRNRDKEISLTNASNDTFLALIGTISNSLEGEPVKAAVALLALEPFLLGNKGAEHQRLTVHFIFSLLENYSHFKDGRLLDEKNTPEKQSAIEDNVRKQPFQSIEYLLSVGFRSNCFKDYPMEYIDFSGITFQNINFTQNFRCCLFYRSNFLDITATNLCFMECHFSYFSYQNVKGIINRYKIKRFLNKIKYYDRLVVLTEEDRKDWGRKDNIVVIPNALTFYPKESADLSIPRVIAVGRLSAQKGFDRLIAIWAEIEPYFPDWKLTIIGSGELQDTLERQIGLLKLKSVEICPPRAEIIREYLGSSVYVLTSRHEGFPMVLHEAMACGLPVVAYTCKCGPRDIIQDRQDGFLIEEGDENEFVKRLSQLMADSSLRQKVGNEARRNIIRFALPSVMKKWENLFITLASQDE